MQVMEMLLLLLLLLLLMVMMMMMLMIIIKIYKNDVSTGDDDADVSMKLAPSTESTCVARYANPLHLLTCSIEFTCRTFPTLMMD